MIFLKGEPSKGGSVGEEVCFAWKYRKKQNLMKIFSSLAIEAEKKNDKKITKILSVFGKIYFPRFYPLLDFLFLVTLLSGGVHFPYFS